MTHTKPYFNNGGRIEWVDGDEQTHVLCTVGETNNQTPEDTAKVDFILSGINPHYELLDELAKLRSDKEVLLKALDELIYLAGSAMENANSDTYYGEYEIDEELEDFRAAIKEVT